MQLIKKFFGLLLIGFGIRLILAYWLYYIKVIAMQFGYGKVKFSSMSPIVAPVAIISGSSLFGQPFLYIPPWLPFLLDANTYIAIISLPNLFKK